MTHTFTVDDLRRAVTAVEQANLQPHYHVLHPDARTKPGVYPGAGCGGYVQITEDMVPW